MLPCGRRGDFDTLYLRTVLSFDSNRGAALSFGNHIGDKDYPLQTFHMVNSLVTGYADDVLMANNKEGVTANYHFYNCILRTPKPKETALLSNFTDVIWENNKDYPDGGSKQFFTRRWG